MTKDSQTTEGFSRVLRSKKGKFTLTIEEGLEIAEHMRRLSNILYEVAGDTEEKNRVQWVAYCFESHNASWLHD